MKVAVAGSSLRWEQKVNLLGRAVQDPLVHICEVCCLPVLIYGRMVSHTCTHTTGVNLTFPMPQKRCRHAFCRDCAKRAAGVCPRCKEGEQTFEEASMGNVYICTHGGGRYVVGVGECVLNRSRVVEASMGNVYICTHRGGRYIGPWDVC